MTDKSFQCNEFIYGLIDNKVIEYPKSMLQRFTYKIRMQIMSFELTSLGFLITSACNLIEQFYGESNKHSFRQCKVLIEL